MSLEGIGNWIYHSTRWMVREEARRGCGNTLYEEAMVVANYPADVAYQDCYGCIKYQVKHAKRFKEHETTKSRLIFSIIAFLISLAIAAACVFFFGRNSKEPLVLGAVILVFVFALAIVWRLIHYRNVAYHMVHTTNRINMYKQRYPGIEKRIMAKITGDDTDTDADEDEEDEEDATENAVEYEEEEPDEVTFSEIEPKDCPSEEDEPEEIILEVDEDEPEELFFDEAEAKALIAEQVKDALREGRERELMNELLITVARLSEDPR